MSQNVEVRIELPLPIDISATLISIIGLTWPGTLIKNGGPGSLLLEIPDAERHKNAKRAAEYAKVKKHLDAEADVDLTELDPNGAGFGLPEYLAAYYTTMARAVFAANPDAVNYLETVLPDPQSSTRYVFHVARSEGQTPHKLRMKAETELEQVRAERDQLRAQLRSAGLEPAGAVVDIPGPADESGTDTTSGDDERSTT